MVEKLITLRQEQAILYNMNHPQYTDKTKRKVAVEKIQEGFEESGLINSLSADIILGKINSLRSYYVIQRNKQEQSKLSGADMKLSLKSNSTSTKVCHS